METEDTSYANWSNEKLIVRVTELEQRLRELTAKHTETSASTSTEHVPAPQRPKKLRAERFFNSESYSTRFIALKFAYLGQRYGGFEHHANNPTRLPTIEEELWRALNKAKLIFPSPRSSTSHDEINFEGLDYAKCGRTDRGVSAFGQVVSLSVRSNRPLARQTAPFSEENTASGNVENLGIAALSLENNLDIHYPIPTPVPLIGSATNECLTFDPIHDEVPYPQILNRILPPDIRVTAWCPAPPLDFSARFSCKERRYRYFFTQPAFSPAPGVIRTSRRDGWLDIEAMRRAAKLYEGLHDFRNFCKVDPSKQIDNFERRIYHADVREVGPELESASYVRKRDFAEHEVQNSSSADSFSSDESSMQQDAPPKMYMFVLHGSAFLWHQVRHMVAILFLIGQGLESPYLITQLLDVKTNPTKPLYDMAEDAPLVLWDCIFPGDGADPHQDALEWIYAGEHKIKDNDTDWGIWSAKGGKFGNSGIVQDVWKIWHQRKMNEALAGMLLNLVVDMNNAPPPEEPPATGRAATSQKVFQGGNSHLMKGRYVPVLERPRSESVEIINERYRVRKGYDKNLEEKEKEGTGFRRVKLAMG
ncbi:MAG: hypothetical protein MMC33_004127 [Icmadophila ericetorum]|nr:hypothetical protein [Icmadophila ericetorum]